MNQIEKIMLLADEYGESRESVALQLGANAGYDDQDPLWLSMNQARQALRAAIEKALAVQPKQELVKCLTCNGHGVVGGYAHDGSFDGMDCPDCNAPQPQPKQEPVAYAYFATENDSWPVFYSLADLARHWKPEILTPLYTAPQPQREWAGLTDDAKYEPIELHVLHSHFAGLLFDFMGWLTSRKERLTLSSADEAGPAVEAITEFGKMRGLMLEDAQVQHWHAILAAPKQHPAWTGLTRVEKMEIIISMTGEDWVYALDAAEAKLREKNT